MTPELINELIKGCDSNLVSDGYHTFGELYEHRNRLFICLCKQEPYRAWRGSVENGWFLLYFMLGEDHNIQVSYHLPESLYDECSFAYHQGPAGWDGHDSKDVLERLKNN